MIDRDEFGEIKVFIQTLKPGEKTIYYSGNLAADLMPGLQTEFRNHFDELVSKGYILTQKKYDGGFHYIAQAPNNVIKFPS